MKNPSESLVLLVDNAKANLDTLKMKACMPSQSVDSL